MIQSLLYLLPPFFLFFFLPVILFFLIPSLTSLKKKEAAPSSIPKSYPLIGSYFAIKANANQRIQWLSDIVQVSPTATFTLHRLLGHRTVITANPANVQHILKTRFPVYKKGNTQFQAFFDLLGNGIFNADGDTWKFQRQVASHQFSTKSLRNFVEQVVDAELSDRLIPILTSAAEARDQVLDFQDVLQRFAFDNICKIAFGFDPVYLIPSLERSKFAQAFEEASEISTKRFRGLLPLIWKIKRKLDIGSEKRLRIAVSEVRELAKKIVREKKKNESLESVDMLSRVLSSGHSDEDFVTDIVISFILAGKDTTSAALTWFFWLLWKNPRVEEEVVREIKEKYESPVTTVFEEMKDMVYTHAALCESMRLYPPVPLDSKEAVDDDVLPDGTVVKKGFIVTYHVYAMGRMESLWGGDWAEFRPERWLERVEGGTGKWSFVGRDSFSYPVFQAGPRVCLGKEMAFVQMKRVVAAVLRRFKVVPVMAQGVEPELISVLTSQMEGGFPVRIHQR